MPRTPEQRQEVWRLVRVVGLTYSEAGQQVGISRRAVAGIIHRTEAPESPSKSRRWTEAENESLLRQRQAGICLRDVRIPGRTAEACRKQSRILSGIDKRSTTPKLQYGSRAPKGSIICDPDGRPGGGYVVGGRR